MNKNEIYNRLVKSLFETRAVMICPENQPFWYTSGKIGPYYINTHFLYGGEEAANGLLAKIDALKSSPEKLHDSIFRELISNYQNVTIFRNLIDDLISYIKGNMDINRIKYISGGERRDWFFSFLAAHFLNKPHITIFKDMSMLLYEQGETREVPVLAGDEVLHVADLITEASSYVRAWIPAIESAGGKISKTIAIIDRMQGGSRLLAERNIETLALAPIDIRLFDKALEMGYISDGQYKMVRDYIADPETSMKNFIKSHPDFLEKSLSADPKTAERARLCIEKGFYS